MSNFYPGEYVDAGQIFVVSVFDSEPENNRPTGKLVQSDYMYFDGVEVRFMPKPPVPHDVKWLEWKVFGKKGTRGKNVLYQECSGVILREYGEVVFEQDGDAAIKVARRKFFGKVAPDVVHVGRGNVGPPGFGDSDETAYFLNAKGQIVSY